MGEENEPGKEPPGMTERILKLNDRPRLKYKGVNMYTKKIIAKRKPGGPINSSQRRPKRKIFLELKSHSLITKGIIHEEYIITLS